LVSTGLSDTLLAERIEVALLALRHGAADGIHDVKGCCFKVL
jgi:hypothetical protein